jgi:hypothetical protein
MRIQPITKNAVRVTIGRSPLPLPSFSGSSPRCRRKGIGPVAEVRRARPVPGRLAERVLS